MMSMFSASGARPELGQSFVAGGSVLAVHPEDALLVAVECHRLVMLLQMATGWLSGSN